MNKTILKYTLTTIVAMAIVAAILYFVYPIFNVSLSLISVCIIALFFIAITVVSAYLVSKKLKEKKDLSVGYILALRFLFFFAILLFVFINMWISKEQILGITLSSVLLTIIFLIYETKLLLLKNNTKQVEELE